MKESNYSFKTSDGREFHARSEWLRQSTESIVVEFNVIGPQTNAIIVFHMSKFAASRIREGKFSEPYEDWLQGFGFQTIKNSVEDGSVHSGDYYLVEHQITSHDFIGSKLEDLIQP
ncbi:hypothetical protein [Alicyclobacillus sp. SO9]|uniref:hypothetical protein n=1 Tax=Alicyclobacillus sp. SO9 TaxID=2665646 RepID=UPI0018E8CF9D|nr:hypothetical protein [Alicyclobacillus sp. SO9]QQE77284.1 hypothetical protein GI364_15095 [Alicyclobacillus sp. SO9]